MNRTAEGYRRWAEIEARGSSPTYENWAVAVSESRELIRLIDALPDGKRQPNLVFAAARWNGIADGTADFAPALIARWDHVKSTILTRSTQTNEPARCAALLFGLEQIEGPIALIEVGASAGLCLILDSYDYRFIGDAGEQLLVSDRGSHVLTIECAVEGTLPPQRMPDIRWRVGIDLNPVNLHVHSERAWLETLIWPEHDDRRDRLRRAATEWSTNPANVVAGDLLDGLDSLAGLVPSRMTTVVMHSAVFAYLPPEARAIAGEAIGSIADHRVSLEGPGVLPEVAAALPEAAPGRSDALVLALDGAPIGLASPHGGRFEAIAL